MRVMCDMTFFGGFFWLIFSFNKNANQSHLVFIFSHWNIFILISCITFCYDVYLETLNSLCNFIHSISYVFVILIRKFQKIRKIIGILRNSRKISNLKLIKKFNLKPFESRFEYLTSNKWVKKIPTHIHFLSSLNFDL